MASLNGRTRSDSGIGGEAIERNDNYLGNCNREQADVVERSRRDPDYDAVVEGSSEGDMSR